MNQDKVAEYNYSETNDDLAVRMLSAAFSQIAVAVIMLAIGPFAKKSFPLAGSVYGVIGFNFARWCLSWKATGLYSRLSPRAWRTCFWVFTAAVGISWGWVGRSTLIEYGLQSYVTMTVFLLMTGMASSSCSSLSPLPPLAHLYTSLSTIPIMVTFCLIDGPARFTFGAVSALYLFYLQTQIFSHAKTHERLKSTQNQFRALADSTMEAVLIHENGVITEVNDSACMMFHYAAEEMVGKNIYDLIIPEDMHDFVRETSQQNMAEPYEVTLTRKEGDRFSAEAIGRWTDYLGHRVRVSCLRDITERKNIEETLRMKELKLRALMDASFDSLPCVVWTASPTGEINYFNEKWYEYTGSLASYNDIVDLSAVHSSDRVKLAQWWKTALQSGEVFEVECRLLRASDNEYRLHLINACLVKDVEGQPLTWFGTMMDVDDRRRSEDQRTLLLARERAAMESSRLKSEFLANMSHEIRTPLNGIIGTADLLLDMDMSELERKYVNVLKHSGDALMAIINDILDFSKIEAGKLELELSEFSLASCIESQVELLMTRALEKDLSLVAYIDPKIPSRVVGDAGRIGQVLLNLMGNAIKFTAKGSVVVRVEVAGESDDAVDLRFSVKDSGIGIDEETRARLFRPFTQADGSTARRFGGTGLGLSISQRLVMMMKGQISIISDPGAGSEFWFMVRLPRGTRPSLALARTSGVNAPLSAIVISDDEVEREVITSYLAAWGMRSLGIASSDAIATTEFGEQTFDVCLITESALQLNAWRGEALPLVPGKKLSYVVIKNPGREEPARPHFPLETRVVQLWRPVKQSELYDALMNVVKPRSSVMPTVAHERGTRAEKKTYRVLVAEDNSTNQMLVLANLSKLGYASHAVANGKEAIDALKDGPYDLILMDCQMPEMDGFTATKMIREIEKKKGGRIPIVALTANAMKEDEERCLDIGMDDYIAKPVRREKLARVLERWLNNKHRSAA